MLVCMLPLEYFQVGNAQMRKMLLNCKCGRITSWQRPRETGLGSLPETRFRLLLRLFVLHIHQVV